MNILMRIEFDAQKECNNRMSFHEEALAFTDNTSQAMREWYEGHCSWNTDVTRFLCIYPLCGFPRQMTH